MSSILGSNSYVKFLTCQGKPSKLLQGLNVTEWEQGGLTYRNMGFRQDFWQNKNLRNIKGLVHGAPQGCYGRVKTFVKWHKYKPKV